MLTFDKKSLSVPVLSTGVVYYKWKLWTYNLGIHDDVTDHACMHMWDEDVAPRGFGEVGSSILTHIKEMVTDSSHLIHLQRSNS